VARWIDRRPNTLNSGPLTAANTIANAMAKKKKWFYKRDGEQQGPFANREIREMVRTGDILPTDLLWKEGMQSWIAAGSVPKLFRQIRSNRRSSPSVRLLIISGALTVAAIIASPVSELARGFTGVGFLACTVGSAGCVVGAVVTFILAMIGNDPEPVTVPTEGRLVRDNEILDDDGDEMLETDKGLGEPVLRHAGVSAECDRADGLLRRLWLPTLLRESEWLTWGTSARAGVNGILVVVAGGAIVLAMNWGGKERQGRFAFRTLSGIVTAGDDKPIVGVPILLKFILGGSPMTSGGGAPPGLAMVNPETGGFNAVIAFAKEHKGTECKVVVLSPDERPMDQSVLPLKYADVATTPIVVDTEQSQIKVKLPELKSE
jgi:hypothetical protein